MNLRAHILFFFFFASSTSAAILNSESSSSFSVKAVYRPTHTLTSGPKTLITHQQMYDAGIMSLAQALQNIGGLQLQDLSSNGGQASISMRGFGTNASSNTLLLVNGIPITNPDLAPPDLNTIPLHEIEYIEIVAGSESVLYGDQAVGGIINVVTRQYASEKTELSCSGGSYNQFNCYASLHNQLNHIKYNATISNRYTDNYRDNNRYNQTALVGNFIIPFDSGKWNIDYKIAQENMRYPGALTAEQVRHNRRQAKNSTDYFKDWSYLLLAQYQQQLNTNWRINTDFSRRDMKGNGRLTSPFQQTRMTHYARSQAIGRLDNVLLTSGIDLQDDRYHLGSLFGITNEKQQKYSGFSTAKILVTDKLFLSAGARGAQQNSYLHSFGVNNNINRAFASTLGGTYQATREISYYLRRAESFRFPKADENAFTPPGVTSLRTQRGVAYETGILLQNENLAGKVEIYSLNLRDEITFDPTQTPETPFGSNRNLAPTIRTGFSISGKTSFWNKASIDGQYNYVNARFQNGIYARNRIPLVSENIFRSGIDYHFAANWNFYSEAIFTGSQFPANDDANNAGKIGGYTVYNFNLRYHCKHLHMAFHINNIFDKKYYFYTVLQNNGEFFYPAPERNVTFSINYAFL